MTDHAQIKAFEIVSFPDLSLPRYFDLFGDEALSIASTRLFNWIRLTIGAGADASFGLRFIYDPQKLPAQRRLRIFVLLRVADAELLASS